MHVALVALAVVRFALRLEVGPELDTNANRAERYLVVGSVAPDPIPSLLARGTAQGALAWSAGPSTLRLSATVAGKLFFGDLARRPEPAAQGDRDRTLAAQNVVVIQAAADESVRLGRRLLLGLGGDYYEAFQPLGCPPIAGAADTSCHRDLRSGAPRLAGTLFVGPVDLALAGGGRLLDWKPDDSFSFRGAFAHFGAVAHLRSGPAEDESEWDLGLSGRFEWRRYLGPRLVGATDPGSALAARREDLEGLLTASLAHVGRVLGEVSYTLDYNGSTSYGQSFLRHLLSLKVACDLPGQITATLRVQLVYTGFTQAATFNAGTPVPVSIEDQNRDTLLLDLERPMGRGFALAGRYTVIRNGSGNAPIDYLRHLVYLGVTYRLR